MTLKTALVAPIPRARERTAVRVKPGRLRSSRAAYRSEEHTSELQSHSDLHSFPTRRSSDLIDDAENGACGSDPESEGKDSSEGEARPLTQFAGCIPQIGPQGLH